MYARKTAQFLPERVAVVPPFLSLTSYAYDLNHIFQIKKARGKKQRRNVEVNVTLASQFSHMQDKK